MENRSKYRLAVGLVCLLALFAFVPGAALAEEGAPAPSAVTENAEPVATVAAEVPPCDETQKSPAVTAKDAPAGALAGALFLTDRPDYACPVTCEANACMWFCAGGPRKCVNNCCVCLL